MPNTYEVLSNFMKRRDRQEEEAKEIIFYDKVMVQPMNFDDVNRHESIYVHDGVNVCADVY